MQRWLHALVAVRLTLWREAVAGLNAYSALLFSRNAASALLVLGASCFDPGAGAAGLVAIIAAAATVRTLGYRRDLADSGYFAVNPLLCGLALGHVQPLSYLLLIKAFVLGAAATLLAAGLSELLGRLAQLPALVLPFVLTSSTLAPLLGVRSGAPMQGHLSVPDLPVRMPEFVSSTLRAFGGIVFQPTTAAGLLVLLALVLGSRITALFAILGVALASLVGMIASPHYQLGWIQSARYNSLLVCIALGAVYFVPSRASIAWASFGALLTAWLTLSMGPLFAQWDWPVLAWPFVVVTLVILRAIALRRPGYPPQATPLAGENAERNLRYSDMLATRFGPPGAVKVNLPVHGTWTVTQGFDGPHTHQGRWRHALDFEMLDDEGFPFQGHGTMSTDFYCFDAPVHAVLPGTVVFAYSNHPDNAPGAQDLAYPYGNTVIIQHAPALFSVLAHLRQGSITVQPGQFVAAGTPVGRCGSSGRSPRPHVHLQLQAAAELGTPTLAFELAHYALAGREFAEYFARGVPNEGDRLAGCFALTTPELALLRPGTEFSVQLERRRLQHFRSEMSPQGERYLGDRAGREHLYFSCYDGVATFTSHFGARPSALLTLALALPRISPFDGEVTMTERIPPEWLVPNFLGWVCDIMSLIGLRPAAIAKVHVIRSETELRAHANVELRWCGRIWRRLTAAATIRNQALTWARLTSGSRVLFEANHADGSCVTARPVRRRWRLEPALACLTLPIVGGVAAASLMLASSPSEARSAPNPLAESIRFEAADNLNQALQSASLAASANPREYFPVLRLAYLEKLTKHYAESASHYGQAAALAPSAVEPLLGEIQALMAAGLYGKALGVADAILRLDEQNYLARSSRAWALYQMGRYKEALAEYTLVLELYPGDIEMRLGRAYSLAGAKRNVEAGIEFREVLKRVPNERRARAALGLP
jgi:murein DD-endopeptidase MepM/ murein hydrolase activator NlpD/urea transporter/cytochrome c-type biogenesis protein CcmH/NrfG